MKRIRQFFENFDMKSSRIELVKNGIHAKSGKIKVPRDSIFPRLIKKSINKMLLREKKLPCTWYPVAKYGAMFNAIIQFISFLITSHKKFLLNKYWFSQNLSNFSFQSILFSCFTQFPYFFFSIFFFVYTKNFKFSQQIYRKLR